MNVTISDLRDSGFLYLFFSAKATNTEITKLCRPKLQNITQNQAITCKQNCYLTTALPLNSTEEILNKSKI